MERSGTSEHNSHMGRTGHLPLTIGVSAVSVIAAGTIVALTHGAGPVAHARTTLGPALAAQIVSPDGASRPATAGEVVAPGEVVSTTRHGNAELLTRGRVTMIGAGAAVAVIDGARQQLRTGTAVIDALEGPGLTLDVGSDTVTVPSGSATEADRSVSVRVGSLAGPASVTNSSGRHLAVAPLWQTVINGDALPGTPTPLRLSDSSDESRAAPQLVSDDLAMKTLARGINTTGGSTARAVEASWTGTLLPAGVGVSRSEQVLPVAIADATRSAGGTPQDRYNHVVGWRAEGGSWGVVVHLLRSRAAAVVDALHSLQGVLPAGKIGTVSAQPPGTRAIGGPSGGATGGGGGNTGSAAAAGGSGGAPPATHPGGNPPKPAPTPTKGIVGGLVTTVGGVLHKLIGGILPTKQPKPAATASPAAATPPAGSASASPATKSSAPTLSVSIPDPTPTPAATLTSSSVDPQPKPAPDPSCSGLLSGLLGALI